jgi:hypothetical protein
MSTEERLQFGPCLLLPAHDRRGVRHGYWVLPSVRHPLTGAWYSPVLSTAEIEERASHLGWSVTTINVETKE